MTNHKSKLGISINGNLKLKLIQENVMKLIQEKDLKFFEIIILFLCLYFQVTQLEILLWLLLKKKSSNDVLHMLWQIHATQQRMQKITNRKPNLNTSKFLSRFQNKLVLWMNVERCLNCLVAATTLCTFFCSIWCIQFHVRVTYRI